MSYQKADRNADMLYFRFIRLEKMNSKKKRRLKERMITWITVVVIACICGIVAGNCVAKI